MDTKGKFLQHYHLWPQNHVFRETNQSQYNYLAILANELVKAYTGINACTQFKEHFSEPTTSKAHVYIINRMVQNILQRQIISI